MPSAPDGTVCRGRTCRDGAEDAGGRPDIDFLSALPDELLRRILSFLGARDAISTSRLSRRWRSVSRSALSSLDFSEENCDRTPSLLFIYRALLLHAAPKIKLLRLPVNIADHDVDFSMIDSMLLHAVTRDVRVLHLDFQLDDEYRPLYELPSWIFHCATLEEFCAQNCRLRLPPGHIRLGSLRKMRLRQVEFNGQDLKRLLLSCPVLQSLELACCNEASHLIIDARECTKLEELDIVEGCRDSSDDTEIQIDAPSVRCLRFHGAAPRGRCVVTGLPSLVTASFVFREHYVDWWEGVGAVFISNLLPQLRQVQELTLCAWSRQVLFEREQQTGVLSEFPGVTVLELRTGSQREELPAIISAIRACSRLQTLVISINSDAKIKVCYPGIEMERLRSQALCPNNIVMQHLKTVVIRGLERRLHDVGGENQGIGCERGYGGSEEGDGCNGRDDDDYYDHGFNIDVVLVGFLVMVSPVLEKLIYRP